MKKMRVVLWAAWAVSVGIELAAVMVIFVGVGYLMVTGNPQGNLGGEIFIAIGSGLGLIGAFLFAKVYVALRKEYKSS